MDGQINEYLIGDLKRSKFNRIKLRRALNMIIESKSISKKCSTILYDKDDGTRLSLLSLIEKLAFGKNWNPETLDDDIFSSISDLVYELNECIDEFPKTQKKKLEDLLNKLNVVDANEREEHPYDKLLEHLSESRPKFVFFGNDERQLKGTYLLNELLQRPKSLINLLDLATIDIDEVIDSIQTKNFVKRAELSEKANKVLNSKFSNSWSQSLVFPKIMIDTDSIKIIIESSNGLNELRDRSDGLRQYIAMKSFLEKKDYKIEPILIIDEAEIHLHYNAQADLVSDFEQQEILTAIFYSTHSAGCLPSDLGTGVRVVEPIYNDNKDTERSVIRNSIWRNNGGFSPLLLAMGANVIAFTPARKGLIAEGPSETILLPRIIRESIRKDYLDFQVAPGIASISKDEVKNFELEAAKEAYIVDGDLGGDKNKQKLIEGGIDKSKIIQLPKHCSIEDFVKPGILYDSIVSEFENMGFDKPNIDLGKIPKYGRIKWFEKKCKPLANGFPSKVRIAESIVSNSPSDILIVDSERVNDVKEFYKKAMTAFSL